MKLLGDRFCPMTRVEPVRPGKLLHRVTVADTYEVWKFSVAVAGSKLRMAQWPRLWFGVVESSMVLVPLVAARHKDYDMDEARFENEALSLMERYSREEDFWARVVAVLYEAPQPAGLSVVCACVYQTMGRFKHRRAHRSTARFSSSSPSMRRKPAFLPSEAGSSFLITPRS